MKALTFEYGATEEAQLCADSLGMKLTIAKPGSIPYKEMPKYLSLFDYYIDAKRGREGTILPAMSLTAMQALACGLKVIKIDGSVNLMGHESKSSPC